MASRYGVMVEKLTKEQIEKLIQDYTAVGWTVHSLTELGQHLLLSFDWTQDSDPVHPGKEQ